jgi:protein-disulfide isomerase
VVALLLTLLPLAGSGAYAVAQKPDAPTATLVPARGESNARVVILLFSDFECPYCARVDPVLQDMLATFTADVQVVFKHNPLPNHPRAPLAHEAAVEAARQGRFWDMHDLLFANQQRLEPEHLVGYAEQLGLDVDVFRTALADRRHRFVVDRDAAEARALGVTGTPTLFVNGQRLVGVPSPVQLAAFIKSIVSGTSVADPAAPLAPDTLDLTGAPTRGAPDAPVTIVEYSDFECPFCARATGVVENVWKRYGGKVRWVFKHYPLDFHRDAPLAHRAALAAGEQGQFWQMHDLIFENQRAMKRDDLMRMASDLGLDMTRFLLDLDGDRLAGVMQRDMVEGTRVGVEGTPTFFINGHRLVGAQPLEAFTAIIDRELETTGLAYTRPAVGAMVPSDVIERAMSRGSADAPVAIQWYADLGSALHRDAVTLLKRVLDAYPDEVRVVFHHRPLDERPDRWLPYEATVAAAEQGKFWEIHDLLLLRPVQDTDTLASAARRLGLDGEWFEEGLATGRARAVVERQLAEARQRDVRGAPTFFINGARLDGVVTWTQIEAAITQALSQVRAAKW